MSGNYPRQLFPNLYVAPVSSAALVMSGETIITAVVNIGSSPVQDNTDGNIDVYDFWTEGRSPHGFLKALSSLRRSYSNGHAVCVMCDKAEVKSVMMVAICMLFSGYAPMAAHAKLVEVKERHFASMSGIDPAIVVDMANIYAYIMDAHSDARVEPTLLKSMLRVIADQTAEKKHAPRSMRAKIEEVRRDTPSEHDNTGERPLHPRLYNAMYALLTPELLAAESVDDDAAICVAMIRNELDAAYGW